MRATAPGAAKPGTRMMTALASAAAEVSPDRIAGAILLISDGQVHDADGDVRGIPRACPCGADRAGG